MSAGEEDISVNQVWCEQSDFLCRKLIDLLALLKSHLNFWMAPSSVTNLIHQSSLPSF